MLVAGGLVVYDGASTRSGPSVDASEAYRQAQPSRCHSTIWFLKCGLRNRLRDQFYECNLSRHRDAQPSPTIK
jgi:hypothetical protein